MSGTVAKVKELQERKEALESQVAQLKQQLEEEIKVICHTEIIHILTHLLVVVFLKYPYIITDRLCPCPNVCTQL